MSRLFVASIAVMAALLLADVSLAERSGQPSFGCDVKVLLFKTNGNGMVGVKNCRVAIKKINVTFPHREQGRTYEVSNGTVPNPMGGFMANRYVGTIPHGSGTAIFSFVLRSPLLSGQDGFHWFMSLFTPPLAVGRKVTLTLTAVDGKLQTIQTTVANGETSPSCSGSVGVVCSPG